MDSREIEHVLRGKLGTLVEYKGVFTADTMPRIVFNIKAIVFITNTLSSTSDISIVGHWVAFYISFHPKKIVLFYDSYGLSPHFYNEEFTKFISYYSNYHILEFGRQIQPDASQKCGLYTIQFVHYLSYYGLEKYKILFQNQLTRRNLTQNDRFVTTYYFKHVLKKTSCSPWKMKQGYKRAITYKECLSYKR